ncbi:hypothetical protein FN846DRAFT_222404 [Sphaerosporella brunnea]|uniref:Uncharacterized protein n=1 Tax=Sphaerosporella brunnea TaxID=1250544 RepID=A0A5J5F7L8_9PEZI|nr:hypothetical protein FN846DRAFT_222404 [Sphaerosporella brunnea]
MRSAFVSRELSVSPGSLIKKCLGGRNPVRTSLLAAVHEEQRLHNDSRPPCSGSLASNRSSLWASTTVFKSAGRSAVLLRDATPTMIAMVNPLAVQMVQSTLPGNPGSYYHTAGSQKEMKSEMNAKFDKMDAKIDANFDKLNTKMDREYDKRMYCKFDRLLYAIIGSFATVLSTGGFASYLTWKKQ